MKKKILHHTSIMIIFAVLVTFLAASVVTYNKLNTYMQRGVREEAQYICLAMEDCILKNTCLQLLGGHSVTPPGSNASSSTSTLSISALRVVLLS